MYVLQTVFRQFIFIVLYVWKLFLPSNFFLSTFNSLEK